MNITTIGLALALAALPSGVVSPNPAHRLRPKDMGRTEWYGKHLASMAEPELWRSTTRNTAIRLLVLPTFAAPQAIRIVRDSHGWHGHLITTDGRGGYEAGAVTARRSFAPDPADVRHLLQMMETAKFAQRRQVKLDDDVDGSDANERTEGKEIVVCADGTQFVIELRSQGTYKLVSRHDCDLDEELRAVVQQIAQIGGITDPTSDREQ